MDYCKEDLDFIVNHVVLPPKLPQGEDIDAPKKEDALLRLVLKEMTDFAAACPPADRSSWRSILKMLSLWAEVHRGSTFCKETLQEAFKSFEPGRFIFLYLNAQNSGIVIRGDGGKSVVFDSFEASPQCAEVVGAPGRLIRTFPGRSVSVSYEVLSNPYFRDDFATSLQRMHMEQVDVSMKKTTKANSVVLEERDTAHPGLVTEKLMNILAALGEARASEEITKHTRDDVLWNNSKLPWRRSPFWLVLRVAIQSSIYYAFEKDPTHSRYKNFLLCLTCGVSKLALDAESEPDTLITISTKIARRFAKLGASSLSFVSEAAQRSSRAISLRLNLRWSDATKVDSVKTLSWNRPVANDETFLKLSNSRKYLESAMGRGKPDSTVATFTPTHEARMHREHRILPTIKSTSEKDRIISLADFEWWVDNCLGKWLDSETKSAFDCTSLDTLITAYSTNALRIYRDSPRDLSYAILTIVELWVALDKICVQLHPLLSQYTPEIRPSILEPLLLPDFPQMLRQHEIEGYLQDRWTRATGSNAGIFARLESTSFAVRFFNGSPEHQGLKSKIERQAAESRKAKEDEWKNKTSEYESLVQQTMQMEHLWIENEEDDGRYHSSYCSKCHLERQAQSLSIAIHEWPLPADTVQLRAAVFELGCPEAFVAWRDSTWRIIQDLGRARTSPASEVHMRLLEYQPLKEHALRRDGRFTLGSSTKSFAQQTHYKASKFPVQLERICVNNGLRYEILVQSESVTLWAAEQTDAPTLERFCNLQLPSGPYSNLQWTVNSTSHQPNEVLARQDECSPKLKRREFLEFGSLRSGESIQWHNILREFGCSNLSFKEEAVNTLILQAAWQAGSSNKDEARRQAHVVFRDSRFCNRMVEMLHRMLDTVAASWKEQHSLSILVSVALRTLSLAPDTGVCESLFVLLQRARKVAQDWCRKLTTYVHEGSDHIESNRRRRLLLQAADTCLMTYDVGTKHVELVLNSDDDVATLIESSILIYDNTPTDVSSLPLSLRYQLFRSQKIRHALEPRLRLLIIKSSRGINKAIRSLWNEVSFQGPWLFLPGNEQRWATNLTKNSSRERSIQVHYNLLTGEMLADGQPLGQVPRKYMDMPLYKTILGTRILDVLTSDMPGMQYMISREISGHRIHLGMTSDKLLIRARTRGRELEALPPGLFAGDLPRHFAHNFVHWLDLETGNIEFRPLDSVWQPSIQNWQLQFAYRSASLMSSQQRQLLETRSEIASHIADILQVLDDKDNMHITRDDRSTVEVELPRLRLRFFLNQKGRLESRELAAVVDHDQTVGCLWGLKNKLVLEDVGEAGVKKARSVIVPFGDVSIRKGQKHVHVNIDTGHADLVRNYRYSLDQHLWKLRGPPDLLSNLFKAYLHAVTTFVLPDKFTGRTGQEEALENLREESMRSCFPLEADIVRVLTWISYLTPHRSFYPPHLRQMQKVGWNDQLSPLAQHEEFDELASDIWSHAERFAILHDVPPSLPLKRRGDSYLQHRSINQNARYRKKAIGGMTPLVKDDRLYRARDAEGSSARGRRVYEIAAVIKRWPSKLEIVPDLAKTLRSWGTVSGYHENFDVETLSKLLNLSFPQNWGSLYDLCRRSKPESDTYRLMFLFCTIAFDQPASPPLIRTLLAFAFSGGFRDLAAPKFTFFNFQLGDSPNLQELTRAVHRNCVEFVYNANPSLSKKENKRIRLERLDAHEAEVTRQTELFSYFLLKQWPCRELSTTSYPHIPLIKLGAALRACQILYYAWDQNRQFFEHLEMVQLRLEDIHCLHAGSLWRDLPQALPAHIHKPTIQYSSLVELIGIREPPDLPPSVPPLVKYMPRKVHEHGDEHFELQAMIYELRSSPSTVYQEYGQYLQESLSAWENSSLPVLPTSIPLTEWRLQIHENQTHFKVDEVFHMLQRVVNPSSIYEELMSKAGLWPTLTPQSLLQLLSVHDSSLIDDRWRRCLVAFAEVIALYQRSERLLKLSGHKDVIGFFKEAEERGRENWDPLEFPAWLLMEVENNFSIRKIQARVAQEMISKKPVGNFVLQLNMGEGKSSVILPMIIAALADQKQLVRVLVLKPLLRQTESLFSQRLGGLVNRRIYHTPFSRRTKLDSNVVNNLRAIYSECMKSRGVLIALPEHILSFRLMGLERISRDRELSKLLLSTEVWLQRHCRDVLDESDELLDVRFQLVYTVDNQQMMNGSPDRWLVSQDLLALVNKHVDALGEQFPGGIDFVRREGSFAMISNLSSEAADELVSRIVDDVLKGHVVGVSFYHCSALVHQSLRRFIRDRSASAEDASTVHEALDGSSKMSNVLLLRGLLAHKILPYALHGKRWLVEYGLDPSRCMMAVPYRAKGMPSPSSEFGHPDVAILLTCLSYYFSGLTSDQLRQSFELLLKESNSSDEYLSWCEGCTQLPEQLRALEAVNLDDLQLCDEQLFPQLKYSLRAINFFLSRVVFLREGKEFKLKISSSAWDIPATANGHRTVGFSGTNDNRLLLPLSIRQSDLEGLHHTNAMVLMNLLQRNNRGYHRMVDQSGKKLSVEGMLNMISKQSPPIRVLIDVGAQVLEMENRDVVEAWLKLVPGAKAAIFFDNNHDARVVDRQGNQDRLVASPFHRRVSECLIYLDEAHTRGIDLAIPAGVKAAVTLGPRLTKDKLVQAAMRMRKLGCGHSVAFFAPPEVHQEIEEITRKYDSAIYESKDVIRWAMEQTCRTANHARPLWVIQGLEHARRQRCHESFTSGFADVRDASSDNSRVKQFWEAIKEPEARTLCEMYNVGSSILDAARYTYSARCKVEDKLLEFWKSLDQAALCDAAVSEEQEREIAYEVERELQVQRPPQMKPLPHRLDPKVESFVTKGVMPAGCPKESITLAFDSLQRTSASMHLEPDLPCPCLQTMF